MTETLEKGCFEVFTEAEVTQAMRDVIEPFLAARERAFEIPVPGGVIKGVVYTADSPRGSVMLSHGFTESRVKFREMIYLMLKEGYSVVAHDHRGHGYSRQKPGGPTDIDSFQTYVDDFNAAAHQELERLPRPHILYAHSMGGLIGAAMLEQHPGIFDRAVLSSPLFELNGGGIPQPAARAAAEAMCLAGMSRRFLPGHGGYSHNYGFKNSPANSEARYALYYNAQEADPFLQNGGPSCRWTRAALRMCRRVLKKRNLAKVTAHVLLFTAEHDTYVLPGGQQKFIAGIKNGRRIAVPGVKHEIYMSGDDIFPSYVKAVFEFIR